MRPYEVFRGQDSLGGFGYLLFRPADFNPLRKYPLLLFLHGAAERGDSDDPEGIFATSTAGTIPCLLTRANEQPHVLESKGRGIGCPRILKMEFVVVVPRGTPTRHV